MRFYIPITLTAIGLLMSALATSARAQADLPFGPENYDCDLQLFAPVEIDLNDQPYHDDHGYFFKYDKLLWSITGEKVLIGDPTITYESERIYYQNPGDLGTITPPYTIVNGIEDAYPDAGFANGNRFELGYNSCEGAGWAITALQGPNLNQHNVFGGFGDAASQIRRSSAKEISGKRRCWVRTIPPFRRRRPPIRRLTRTTRMPREPVRGALLRRATRRLASAASTSISRRLPGTSMASVTTQTSSLGRHWARRAARRFTSATMVGPTNRIPRPPRFRSFAWRTT